MNKQQFMQHYQITERELQFLTQNMLPLKHEVGNKLFTLKYNRETNEIEIWELHDTCKLDE